ncbi:tyrosine-type recombinase/integrase [Microvirga arsenatis]|uniref:Tyrosine-type recombinase/integrase n=1 Tax=Microvirga arsenatis TaxID=2692265 RepID=A0ABW9YZ15_9HYPH|nr:tyrosine-type recombinase/integrase [Microvirga arsenatis]NBJ13297.1 tyrosine-type recombinase/integrase [Microvirga arsenatis]NBJ24081.1 tyrosine-type recombinase/integrase [Microvirga arsenatis]
MRVMLKGIHRVPRRLADGTKTIYYYAWRGGPRLRGEPGSSEFLASYQEAHKGRTIAADGTLHQLVTEFRGSSEYKSLSDSSKRAYQTYLNLIDAEFGDLPLEALTAPEIRGDFKAWRDGMADTPRKADYAWTVLARVLSVAKDRGRITVNPCERGGRLYKADRNDLIWTEDTLRRLFTVASPEVMSVVIFGLWTGQRQGDLLRLPWSAYDGKYLRLKQGKTGARVTVPVGVRLAEEIGSLKKHGTIMLTSSDKTPWTSDGFRASFRKACAKAGIGDLHFNDLRGTAVTRLAIAGATEFEIAAITGHTVKDVHSILDRHYLSRDVVLAENAIRKLEAHNAQGRSSA